MAIRIHFIPPVVDPAAAPSSRAPPSLLVLHPMKLRKIGGKKRFTSILHFGKIDTISAETDEEVIDTYDEKRKAGAWGCAL